jgi:hypothetical protein
MTDRHGNRYFTDAEQVDCLLLHMRIEGFAGTREELLLRAEAWWWGDWPGYRCPSLEEARTFLAARQAAP